MRKQRSFKNSVRSTISTNEDGSTERRVRKWRPFWRFKKRAVGRPVETCSVSSVSEVEIPQHDVEETAPTADNRFTEKNAYEFVWDYHEAFGAAIAALPDTDSDAWKSFWTDFHTKDFLFVRPSGNSLSLQGMIAQLETGDISNYEEDVIMVENIKCFGNTAVLVYKSETRFLYKGNKVEDSRTNTIVLVWDNGRPKMTNIQRSTGQDINSTR